MLLKSHHATDLMREVYWGRGGYAEDSSEGGWKGKESGQRRHWLFIKGHNIYTRGEHATHAIVEMCHILAVENAMATVTRLQKVSLKEA